MHNSAIRSLSLMLLLAGLLSACATTDSQTSTPTTPPFTSEISVTQPQPGSVIYAETITVTGEVSGDAAQGFVVELLGPEGVVLASSQQEAAPGPWSVELPHTFSGETAPATLRVRPPDAGEGSEVYASIALLIGDIAFRPEGVFAALIVPQDGDTLGGDTLAVEGTASGVESLTVELRDAAGDLIEAHTVALHNPYLIDEVPWQVAFERGERTGPAVIRVLAVDPSGGETSLLAEANVLLGEAAG